MKLNPLIVKSYRVEYETTDITKEALKTKYKLPADFNMDSWSKTDEPTPAKPEPIKKAKAKIVKKKPVDTTKLEELKVAPIEGEEICLDNIAETITAEIVGKQLPDSRQPSTPEVIEPEVVDDYKTEMNSKIREFKVAALNHCVKFMSTEAEFAEVKEFKDMVAVVDSIDKSLKDSVDTGGTTVNVLVQNIMSEFHDDC